MDETEHGPGQTSFEARLKAAQARQAPEPATAKASGTTSDLGIGMRVGVELVSALAVALAIGWGLDHWLHTMPLFLIIFVLLGGVAGVLNVWRTMAPRRPGH